MRASSLVVLSGLVGLLTLPGGAGLLRSAARAASEVEVRASSAAASGCSSADFKAPATFDVSGSQFARGFPTDIALGDFNGDGRADVAVSHQGQAGTSPTVSIALDNGAGGYTPSTPISYFPASTLWRVVAADFNEDGRADVAAVGVISSPFSHVLSVSLSNPDGTFGTPNDITNFGGQNPYDLAVGEFNADDNLDLVVVNGSQNYTVFFGNGAGGFTAVAQQFVGTRFDRVAVADFNADSKQDFAITDFDDRRVVILRNNDNGVFGVTQNADLNNIVPDAVVAADFNGDHKPDLAVAGHPFQFAGPATDGSLAVLLNDGSGGFAAPVYYKTAQSPRDIIAADLDGDSRVDLAVAGGGTLNAPSAVYVLSGDGAGAFSHPAIHHFAGAPTAVAARDLDGDGRTDIAGPVTTGSFAVLYGKAPVALPCVLVDDVTVVEGDSGSSAAAVTFRLSDPATQEVRVNYQLTGLFAVEGRDYTGTSGTVTFAPGETSKDLNIPVIGDLFDEVEESVTVHLSGPVNARLSDPTAKLTITDNDPPPAVSINDVSVAEGDSTFNANQAVFTVTLSAPSGVLVRVDYSTAAGTATAGNDFGTPSGPLFFEEGTTSKTVTVSLGGDRTHEPDETFFVNLSNPGNCNCTIADGQGQGTILNDDPVPAITLFNSGVFEPSGGAGGTASMTVRLSNPSSLPVSVNYATADGTATAGSDYAAASGTVNFAPGETEKSITLTALDDSVDEVDEEFLVNLTGPTNATVEDGQASCLIFDNDGPTVSVNDVSVVEGQGGRTLATFTLSLSAPSPQATGVRATTADGTAASNVFPFDFQSANRPLNIPAGSTTATFTVLVNGDLVIEPDETFLVNLSQPSGCTIGDGQGVGTIVNDDVTSVQFSTAELTVGEAAGSVQATVTRVGDTSGSINVVYGTFDSTASERSDYTAAFGTLQFGPGETSKSIVVLITDDALVENPESFVIALGAPGGGATNQPSLLTVTVNSDDTSDGPNPVNDSTFFVRQHYRDFLSRDPDPDGLAFWTGEIEQCGADAQCREVKRVNVSAAFFLSIEFQNTGYLVERMYKAAYGDTMGTTRITGTPVQIPVPVIRRADFLSDAAAIREGVVVNVGDWERQLEANKNAFALTFVQRQRFRDAYPTALTPAAFVNALDQNTGGSLTPAEAEALAAEFGGAAGTADEARRAVVFRKVAEHTEFDRRERNRAFVLMQFFGYLQRDPYAPPDADHTGWKFWLDKLNDFNGNYIAAEMVKAFIQSDEYRKRFGR